MCKITGIGLFAVISIAKGRWQYPINEYNFTAGKTEERLMLVVNQKQETYLHVKSNLIHQNSRENKDTRRTWLLY